MCWESLNLKEMCVRTRWGETWNFELIIGKHADFSAVWLGDVDSSALAFHGIRVFAIPRALRALRRKQNLVDLDRRS